MSTWPKPIIHLDRHVSDATCMIIIKSCGLCEKWYHYGDVAMTSHLHTFQLACLCEHLKTNNRCTWYAIKDCTLIGGVIGGLDVLMRI
jgi:hypothetical protein